MVLLRSTRRTLKAAAVVVCGVGGIDAVGGGVDAGGDDGGGYRRTDPWWWPSWRVPSPHRGGGCVADGVADGCWLPLVAETGFPHTRWRVVRSRVEAPPA